MQPAIPHRELLDAFDTFERQGAAPQGLHIERTPFLVRELPAEGSYWIGWSDLRNLEAAQVDEILEAERAYALGLGRSVEWKHYDYDAPGDLLERLARCGFLPGEPETVLATELGGELGGEPSVPSTAPVKLVRPGPDDLQDMHGIYRSVWPNESDRVTGLVRDMLRLDPRGVDAVVAYVGEVPVSAGWSSYRPGSPFVGLWGGATIPSARRQGTYRAVVAERLAEALRRGRRYAYVDAAPTSAPILMQLGFTRLARTTPCVMRTPVPSVPGAAAEAPA